MQQTTQRIKDLVTVLNPHHEGKLVYPDGGAEEYEIVDGERHCLHINHTLETGEADTMRNGEHDTYEFTYAECPNPVCDGITDTEQEVMSTPEEPDYEPYE